MYSCNNIICSLNSHCSYPTVAYLNRNRTFRKSESTLQDDGVLGKEKGRWSFICLVVAFYKS